MKPIKGKESLLNAEELFALAVADPLTKVDEGIDIDNFDGDWSSVKKTGPYVQWIIKQYLNLKTTDDDGQIIEGHSISAGLDYPGVGPEHAYLKDIGRAEYVAITDKEALEASTSLPEIDISAVAILLTIDNGSNSNINDGNRLLSDIDDRSDQSVCHRMHKEPCRHR